MASQALSPSTHLTTLHYIHQLLPTAFSMSTTHPPPPFSATPPDDPPPPYPSARRSRHNRRRRALPDNALPQPPSDEYDPLPSLSPNPHHFPLSTEHPDPVESTPLLNPHTPRPLGPIVRRRTLSLTSTLRSSTSLAPSFAHTVFSAFHPELDSDIDPDCPDVQQLPPDELDPLLDSPIPPHYHSPQTPYSPDLSAYPHPSSLRLHHHLSFAARSRRYFRPLKRRAYYSALFHILILNFPCALFAWIFLFVFTLVGTCTLMALPLGAVICFIDLLGARLLSRGELALQTTFHGPLSYPLPHPPLPIFTRIRPPTPAQLEAGVPPTLLVQETSFYRNAYAMFTDPTSYQALFYFLVLKPGITVLMFLFFILLVPIAALAVFPLPAVLRLVRRVGIWQANVAVEGLYFAAR